MQTGQALNAKCTVYFIVQTTRVSHSVERTSYQVTRGNGKAGAVINARTQIPLKTLQSTQLYYLYIPVIADCPLQLRHTWPAKCEKPNNFLETPMILTTFYARRYPHVKILRALGNKSGRDIPGKFLHTKQESPVLGASRTHRPRGQSSYSIVINSDANHSTIYKTEQKNKVRNVPAT